jgi:hypothetical protein
MHEYTSPFANKLSRSFADHHERSPLHGVGVDGTASVDQVAHGDAQGLGTADLGVGLLRLEGSGGEPDGRIGLTPNAAPARRAPA